MMMFSGTPKSAADLPEGQRPRLSHVMRSDVIQGAGLGKCRQEHREQMGYEHISPNAFHACVDQYQRNLGAWATAETPDGQVYWFNQQNMSTQWERPDPLKTDIEQAVKEAKGPEAYKSYVGSEPWHVCEFLSLRWFGCHQREGDQLRCTKEMQEYLAQSAVGGRRGCWWSQNLYAPCMYVCNILFVANVISGDKCLKSHDHPDVGRRRV